MRIPKKYGESKKQECPFCGKQAISQNSQKVPVCLAHKNELLKDLKCVCGDYVDILNGKYGVFFNCLNCGNVNYNRVMSVNQVTVPVKANPVKKKRVFKKEPTERTVSSDELDFI
tara:strand:+ start:2737 stop:3081 length:345 start_codon:yes stop_codon:yes gene_type:complete